MDVIDKCTGEVVSGRFRENGKTSWSFFMGNTDGYLVFAKQKPTSCDCWVLFVLLGHSNHLGVIRMTQAEIADYLDVSRSAVNKSIHRLIELGVIVREDTCRYKLNAKMNRRGSRANGSMEG